MVKRSIYTSQCTYDLSVIVLILKVEQTYELRFYTKNSSY
jgi:hypothetical protein